MTDAFDAGLAGDPISAPRPAFRAPLGLLAGLLVLRLALLFVTHYLSAIVVAAFEHDGRWVGWAANLWIVPIDIITLLVVRGLLHREGLSLRGLVFDLPVFAAVWRGVVVFVCLVITYFVGSYVGNLIAYGGTPPMPGGGVAPPLWFGVWSMALMPVTIAFAEEALYRGYVQPRMSDRLGKVVGVAVVAVAFGAQHLGFAIGSGWQVATVRVVASIAGGVFLGILYAWKGRLASLIFAHWLLDVLFLGLPFVMWALAS